MALGEMGAEVRTREGGPLPWAGHWAGAGHPVPTDTKAGVTVPLLQWGNRSSEGPAVLPRSDGGRGTEVGASSGPFAPAPVPGCRMASKMRK